MKERFTEEKFSDEQMKMIRWANETLHKYQQLGYTVTVRQVFYAAVTINLIENTKYEYTKLGDLLTKARMGGWLDWDVIVDRGRVTRSASTLAAYHLLTTATTRVERDSL